MLLHGTNGYERHAYRESGPSHVVKKMNIFMRKTLLGLLAVGMAAGVLSGCHDRTPDEDPTLVADSFAEAYFNYDFSKALGYCTPESGRWIRFAASNIYAADVEALRGMASGATVEIDDVDDGDTDSTAVATVNVDGYLQRDTIGRPGRVMGAQTYRLPLVRRDGKWQVNLTALPREVRPEE